jgi:hypothetical protein
MENQSGGKKQDVYSFISPHSPCQVFFHKTINSFGVPMSKITEAIKKRKTKKNKKTKNNTSHDFIDIEKLSRLSEVGVAASEAGKALRLFVSCSANFAIAMHAAKSNYDRAIQERMEEMLMVEPLTGNERLTLGGGEEDFLNRATQETADDIDDMIFNELCPPKKPLHKEPVRVIRF